MFTQILISFFLFLNPFVSIPPSPVPAAPATDEGGIVWQPERRLSWDDFRSEADNNQPLHAMTSTNIEVQANCYGNQMTFEVKCVFQTKDSWSKNKKSIRLLAHEQMHFDLTEVHARRLRQKLGRTPGLCGTDKARFGKIVEAHFADWKAEQDQYDRESNHGLNEDKQLFWEERIARELAHLSSFAFTAKH